MTPKKLSGTGSATINLVSAGNEADYYEVRVTDKDSSLTFLSFKVSLVQFAKVLAGREVPVEWTACALDKLGTKREWKTEEIALPDNVPSVFTEGELVVSPAYMKIVDKATEPYRIGGWIYDTTGFLNRHNLVRGTKATYKIRFERWVPKEASDAPA